MLPSTEALLRSKTIPGLLLSVRSTDLAVNKQVDCLWETERYISQLDSLINGPRSDILHQDDTRIRSVSISRDFEMKPSKNMQNVSHFFTKNVTHVRKTIGVTTVREGQWV